MLSLIQIVNGLVRINPLFLEIIFQVRSNLEGGSTRLAEN